MGAPLRRLRDADGPDARAEELAFLLLAQDVPAGEGLGDRGGELGHVEIGASGAVGLDGLHLGDLAVDLMDAPLGLGQGAEARLERRHDAPALGLELRDRLRGRLGIGARDATARRVLHRGLEDRFDPVRIAQVLRHDAIDLGVEVSGRELAGRATPA